MRVSEREREIEREGEREREKEKEKERERGRERKRERENSMTIFRVSNTCTRRAASTGTSPREIASTIWERRRASWAWSRGEEERGRERR